MGVRGELYSLRVQSNNDRRTYFLNVKENRTQDLFLTIVESKKKENAEEFERHQVVIFEDDIEAFAREFERVLSFFRERSRPAGRRPRPEEERRPSNGRYRQEQRFPRDRRAPRGDHDGSDRR